MSKIFLINIGANTGHASVARGPIFEDATWAYLPFPHRNIKEGKSYPENARNFIRNIGLNETHSDPDWKNLTYGDLVQNRRAAALNGAHEGDVLLFWGLLWRNLTHDWSGWTGERAWYLFGAITIEEILDAGQKPSDVKILNNRVRAAENVHACKGKVGDGQKVFIGCKKRSQRFEKAVDLGIYKNSGLLFQAIRTAAGENISWTSKPKWNSVTRPVREIFDSSVPNSGKQADSRRRVELLRKAILAENGFDLMEGI